MLDQRNQKPLYTLLNNIYHTVQPLNTIISIVRGIIKRHTLSTSFLSLSIVATVIQGNDIAAAYGKVTEVPLLTSQVYVTEAQGTT